MCEVTPSKVHIIGAGLAGLAAAVSLARRGVEVELSEAAAQAGGRCRSYFDKDLGLTLDNGNHLVLSGNRAVHDYLRWIGASGRLSGPDRAAFAFVDLRTDDRWTVRPNESALPWWTLAPSRRVAGTRAADYLALAPLALGRRGRTVGETARCEGPLWERLMEPFLLAALNTDAVEGDAGLASAVIRETLAKGGSAYRPRIAEPTLAAAFVDPALAFLKGRGAAVRLGRRLREILFEGERAAELRFADGAQPVAEGEAVIVAAPPAVATDLLPGLTAPTEHRAIVNGHFAGAAPAASPPILGVVGGLVEWIFCLPDRISVTISGADRLVETPREELAARMWADVARALQLGDAAVPAWQVVKEKRATFAATPRQDALRPAARTRWRNVALAGDWTDTGLPATLEGAVRSGFHAADLVSGRRTR